MDQIFHSNRRIVPAAALLFACGLTEMPHDVLWDTLHSVIPMWSLIRGVPSFLAAVKSTTNVINFVKIGTGELNAMDVSEDGRTARNTMGTHQMVFMPPVDASNGGTVRIRVSGAPTNNVILFVVAVTEDGTVCDGDGYAYEYLHGVALWEHADVSPSAPAIDVVFSGGERRTLFGLSDGSLWGMVSIGVYTFQQGTVVELV